jgi:hypothetical protein
LWHQDDAIFDLPHPERVEGRNHLIAATREPRGKAANLLQIPGNALRKANTLRANLVACGPEADVNWIDPDIAFDIAEIVLLCVSGTGFLFYLFCAWRRTRNPGPKARLATLRRLESVGELCGLVIVFGGFAVSQIASVAVDLQFCTAPQRLAHFLAVAGGFVLLWGISLGRLSLRWQLRLAPAKDAEPDKMSA